MKYPLVSQRITEILNERNMRAQDLANASGVNKASISQYVNGTNCPSSLTAKKLGQTLGVSPMWLMGMDFTKDGVPLRKHDNEYLRDPVSGEPLPEVVIRSLDTLGAIPRVIKINMAVEKIAHMDEHQLDRLMAYLKITQHKNEGGDPK